MYKIVAEDTDCPFCGNTFFKGDKEVVFKEDGKLVVYCIGCGAEIEVVVDEDGKVHFKSPKS